MGDEVSAPFTDDQVASLNAYQAEGAWHPFTCGIDFRSGATKSPWVRAVFRRQRRSRSGLISPIAPTAKSRPLRLPLVT
jgi:hypothetical protein